MFSYFTNILRIVQRGVMCERERAGMRGSGLAEQATVVARVHTMKGYTVQPPDNFSKRNEQLSTQMYQD